jgi:hypothetical protein
MDGLANSRNAGGDHEKEGCPESWTTLVFELLKALVRLLAH